jgi:hypothetical protein
VRLSIHASAWSFGSIAACRNEVERGHFDGIEGPAPVTSAGCRELRRELADAGVPFIGEVCTGGAYAPPSSVPFARHLADFRTQAALGAETGAELLTCLAGSDSWPLSRAIEFFGLALEIGRANGVELSFETHRSRPTFTPWSTAELLRALPELGLTCDFSHWCVVCERLLEDDDDALALAIRRARHIHARVGYAQGPQVPEPRAPAYARELAAHEAWWWRIWLGGRERGVATFTLTPEFGPDGYLHHHPFTDVPVADLVEINRWMSERQRARFRELER